MGGQGQALHESVDAAAHTPPRDSGETQLRRKRPSRLLGWEIEPLWVGGLVLLCLFIGDSALIDGPLHLRTSLYQWAQYVGIGVVMPAIVLALLGLPHIWRRTTPFVQAAKLTLAAGCLLICILLCVAYGQPYLLMPYAAVLALVQLLFQHNQFLSRGLGRGQLLLVLVTSFVVALAAWTTAVRYMWWTAFGNQALFATSYALPVALAIVVFVCAFLNVPENAALSAPTWWFTANVACFAIIAIFSFSTDGLFGALGEIGPIHHWGVYVGTADLVRQGGWLYWDVPSQYGFLNILALAALPTETPWQALYLLNAICIFTAGGILFTVLRSIRRDGIGILFSIATTIATVYFLASFAPQLLGPHVFPSVGPFRFIWCYVLLALLLSEYRSSAGSRSHYRILLAGNVTWLIGVLWSMESAFYCSAIWLPALVLILLRDLDTARKIGHSWRSAARGTLIWLALPALLLVLAISVIWLWYRVGLGHGPDWRGYVDYVLAFGEGTFSGAVPRMGTVWSLLFQASLLGTAIAYFLREGITGKGTALLAGAWGGFWATNSYFLGTADASNILRVVPIGCFITALLLHLAAKQREQAHWMTLFRVACVPSLAVWLIIPLFNIPALGRLAQTAQSGFQTETRIEQLLPDVDATLLELFATAGVRPSDPILYAGSTLGNPLTAWPVKEADGERRVYVTQSWTPAPLTLVAPLPAARKVTYMERFTTRTHRSGWLIQRKEAGQIMHEKRFSPADWFYDQVLRTHIPTRVYENASWQLIWFDYRGETSAAIDANAPARYHDLFYRGLPTDIRVNGQLQQNTLGQLFVLRGAGWGSTMPNGARWASTPATLYIYSATAMRVQLSAVPETLHSAATNSAIQQGILRVTPQGGSAQPLSISIAVPFDVEFASNPGWTAVELAWDGGNRKASDANPANTSNELLGFALRDIQINTR